jgi:Ca2+-binding RTX toxin-like protein
VILGGSAADVILAGDNNDFVDGRLGDDMIWGEGGADAIFGDSGIDMLLGGVGNDYIHGGGHDDFLYGEAGNDWIFGGGGLDDITDNSGVNTIKIDYGASGVLVNGFETFDWFDRNLDSAEVRSMARLLYRDMHMQRNDMLEVYSVITTDNYVSTAEFNDLKDLLSTKLTMWDMVRNLSKKVVNGDRANQWYQGGTLGNLTAGVGGQHLTNLVDKWFKGGDLPTLAGVADVVYTNVSGSLFKDGINFTDVDQGRHASDCYYLAALAEIAQHKPSDILNMFYDNGDGTFTVRFFHGSTSEYVTVNRMLPIDTDATAHFAGWGDNVFYNTNNELWVALAEKAYMQINESGWIGQDNNNSYTGIQFGYTRHAFAHLTGHGGSDYSLSESGIINAQAAGKAIVIASKETVVNSDVSDNHAYSLVSYNSTTKKFRLFNPHNTTSSKPAFIELTWSQLKQDFSYTTSVVL